MNDPDLKVNLNGKTVTVSRSAYVKAKTAQLREFGYSDLSESAVSEQIDKILAGQKLDVIGMFMQGEVIIP